MATCKLEVLLSEPDKVYVDGEKIRGEVIVNVEKGANCKGLEITSQWTTHGRGNVDRGEVESITAFNGNWQADTTYRYPFELQTASWPPTYHGRLLNVSHQVQARAKLAWALDPKATAEFKVRASRSPTNLADVTKKKGSGPGWIGWTVIGVLLAMLGFMFIFLVPFLLLIGGVIWFFSSYLPKLRTGKVECLVEPLRLRAGDTLRGRMEFTPKVKTRINGVRYSVVCEEKCVSGSGSNRQTHREELSATSQTLIDAGDLLPGQKKELHFEYKLPASASASLDLSDNDLNWFVEYRIDIPRWPDFSRKIPFVVEPCEQMESARLPPVVENVDEPSWYDQVIDQLFDTADSPERLRMVLEAIQGHEFDVALTVDQPAAVPSQLQYVDNGQWYQAFDDQNNVAFLLHIPPDVPAPHPGSTWRGKVGIVGFDATHEQVIATMHA